MPLLLCALILSACTNVRPTLKVGLLAPFEGLHRRSGYGALEAVRAAIADFSYAEAGILPLALDDGRQPLGAQRSAQKLLADDRLAAVVGPLSPSQAHAAEAVLAGTDVPWFAPHALVGEQWAVGLVAAAAELARAEGARGLVLAGWTPGWPQSDAATWTEAAGLPVRLLDEAGGVRADEAVYWLGSPEEGAAYLIQLRQTHPQAIFVLGPDGEDPVFAERVLGAHLPAEPGTPPAAAGDLLQRVYWTVWTDDGYNGWAARHDAESPKAYLIYRATLAALAAATGVPFPAPPASWYVQTFRYTAAGEWSPVLP